MTRLNTTVTALEIEGDRVMRALVSQADGDSTIDADAFVLAIPPFLSQPVNGLPSDLAGRLARIESTATIGLQHWTTGPPRQASVIISGLGGPLRSAAPMTHLAGAEGPAYRFPPVYYCGDVDDTTARNWHDDPSRHRQWLDANAAGFHTGSQAHRPFLKVNFEGSERYVCATPATQSQRVYGFETGLVNLWLAGDWTRTALSCGSIEAAVTSGLEAARRMLRSLNCTVRFPIVGAIDEDSP